MYVHLTLCTVRIIHVSISSVLYYICTFMYRLLLYCRLKCGLIISSQPHLMESMIHSILSSLKYQDSIHQMGTTVCPILTPHFFYTHIPVLYPYSLTVYSPLTSGIIHGDMTISNVIFDNEVRTYYVLSIIINTIVVPTIVLMRVFTSKYRSLYTLIHLVSHSNYIH